MKTTRETRKHELTMWIIGVVTALTVLGLVVYGLWALVSSQSRDAADWWAVIATLLIAPAFFTGFWFGKTEVRGFLSGADKMLDKMSGTVERIVTVRDNSRIAVHNARQSGAQPNYNVILPNVTSAPSITHRALTSGDNDTVDL